jgi:hypothetical protein
MHTLSCRAQQRGCEPTVNQHGYCGFSAQPTPAPVDRNACPNRGHWARGLVRYCNNNHPAGDIASNSTVGLVAHTSSELTAWAGAKCCASDQAKRTPLSSVAGSKLMKDLKDVECLTHIMLACSVPQLPSTSNYNNNLVVWSIATVSKGRLLPVAAQPALQPPPPYSTHPSPLVSCHSSLDKT